MRANPSIDNGQGYWTIKQFRFKRDDGTTGYFANYPTVVAACEDDDRFEPMLRDLSDVVWVNVPDGVPTPFGIGTIGELDESMLIKPPPEPIRNYEEVMPLNSSSKKPTFRPRPMVHILANVRNETTNWPRRQGTSLFIHGENGIQWLPDAASLASYLGVESQFPLDFKSTPDMHTKGELFRALQMYATSYDGIESLPHEPPVDGSYYACTTPPPGDGKALDKLLDYFTPATPIDRDLILAMFATAIWGGPGGSRPAFLITSDVGTGAGKSTLASLLAELCGGAPDISANEDIGKIKSRLLSPEGVDKRVAVLDNVKKLKFSWAELESLVTSPTISGHRMYAGEASRTNLMVWLITLNGASLSTDLAARTVVIKLDRPKYSAKWEDEVFGFLRKNRQEIIGDLIAFLRTDRTELKKHTRWGTWENDILSRLPDPAEAQAVIAERRDSVDSEQEEAELIEDHFAVELEQLTYQADRDAVFLPVATAAQWLRDATGERLSTQGASKKLDTLIEKGKTFRISRCPSRRRGRGFFWHGSESDPDVVNYDISERIDHQKRSSRF